MDACLSVPLGANLKILRSSIAVAWSRVIRVRRQGCDNVYCPLSAIVAGRGIAVMHFRLFGQPSICCYQRLLQKAAQLQGILILKPRAPINVPSFFRHIMSRVRSMDHCHTCSLTRYSIIPNTVVMAYIYLGSAGTRQGCEIRPLCRSAERGIVLMHSSSQ